MNFKTTRRYFKLAAKDLTLPPTEGVKVEGDEIWFDRVDPEGYERTKTRTFSNVDECINWLESKMEFTPNKRMNKTFHSFKAQSPDITDEDWSEMQKFIPSPENLKRTDFRVFESYLAHNFLDRDGERFSKGVLESLSGSIVGKSKLHGHDWGSSGDGRFFKSHIEKLSIDETLNLIGSHPNPKVKEHLEEVARRDGGIYWMVPKFYKLVDDKEEIRKMDAGIIGDMSIGFSAPDLVEVYAEEKGGKKEMLWKEYVNVEGKEAEAYEASDVFLGSQYGARIRKDAGNDEIAEGIEKVLIKHKIIRKENIMDFEIKTLDIKETLDPEKMEESLKSVSEKIEEKASELLQSATDADQSVKDIQEEADKQKEMVKVFGEDMTVEKLTKIKATAEEYHEFLIDETIKYGSQIGAINKDQVDEKKELWAKNSLEEKKDRLEGFIKMYNDKFKKPGQIEEGELKPPETPEDEKKEVNTRHVIPNGI